MTSTCGSWWLPWARNWRRILLVGLVGTSLAILYVMTATPKYLAETRILIEPQESIFTRPKTVTATEADRSALNDEYVQSQVEVVGSTQLLKDVSEKLGLASRGEFGGTESSTLSRLLTVVGCARRRGRSRGTSGSCARCATAHRLSGSRRPMSSSSSSPLAIRNSRRRGKRTDRRLSRRAAAGQCQDDLGRSRLAGARDRADLRNKVRAAEAKVAEFRGTSDLLVGQNNSVLATQQLAELSTELSRVSRQSRGSRATAEGVRTALADGASLDALPEVLSSALIQRLREREVQLKADVADLSATLLDITRASARCGRNCPTCRARSGRKCAGCSQAWRRKRRTRSCARRS